jgi:hypothetical protein
MEYWEEVVIAILISVLVNLLTPKLNNVVIRVRDRIFLNRIYYIPRIQIRTISQIDKVSLTSKTFKILKSGSGKDTYSLQFLISCELSNQLAEYLKKGNLRIHLTFTGVEFVSFYSIDILTHLPNYNNSKSFIVFGPEEFRSPRDTLYGAEIFSPSNQGNFTIHFSYTFEKDNSGSRGEKIKNFRVILGSPTTIDSLHVDSIICEKV